MLMTAGGTQSGDIDSVEDWPEPDPHETFRGAIAQSCADYLGEPVTPESVDPATYGYGQD